MSSRRASPVPRGECRQCWPHAYDPSIHREQRRQGIQECTACLSHVGGCPDNMIVK